MRGSSRTLIICLSPLLAPGLALAESGAEKAQAAPVETLALGNAIQMILGLAAVILIIFACAWLFRRYGRLQGGLHAQLKIVGGLSVGPRERLILVQVGSRQLLVGVAPGTLRTLHVLEENIETAKSVHPAGQVPFLDRFTEALRKQRTQ